MSTFTLEHNLTFTLDNIFLTKHDICVYSLMMATCYWPEHAAVTSIFLYQYIYIYIYIAIKLIWRLPIARKMYVYNIVLKIRLLYHHHITAISGNGMYVLIGITVFTCASKYTSGSHYNDPFSIKLLWHHLKEYVFKSFKGCVRF